MERTLYNGTHKPFALVTDSNNTNCAVVFVHEISVWKTQFFGIFEAAAISWKESGVQAIVFISFLCCLLSISDFFLSL